LSSAYWQILPVAINATHINISLYLFTGTRYRAIIHPHLGRVYMGQRIISIKGGLIHKEVTKSGRLELCICLWNDGSEIPRDWHEHDADHMELKLDFSIMQIVNDMVEMHTVYGKGKNVLDIEDRGLVDLYKKELQEAIDRLNTIKFVEPGHEQ
jgi:transcriptional regulator of NAD metabolism